MHKVAGEAAPREPALAHAAHSVSAATRGEEGVQLDLALVVAPARLLQQVVRQGGGTGAAVAAAAGRILLLAFVAVVARRRRG